MRHLRLLVAGLAALSAVACHRTGPVLDSHAALIADLPKAQVDQWAMTCAPRELALAHSHEEFARLEMLQGDPLRAEEHLATARENLAIALEKAEACRPKDSDGDAIMDHMDACPDMPELVNGYKDTDGCPETDQDGDGLFDDEDRCPLEAEDRDAWQDEDGCPDPDNDGDKLLDYQDKCPNEAEDFNGFQDDDGCPEGVIDADGDGIYDNVDACPNEAENVNEYLDEDGCPDVKPQAVRITRERIEIDEKILFATGKSTILPESYGILDSVAQVMRDYPKIKIRIEGHTDSQGSDSYNLKLSDQRAGAVFQYLVNQGIGGSRMTSIGKGETTPLDTNRTDAGRANNRRVEFHIVDGM
jgi:outer membrane protein OmpA-like peptidoglycan-associated protein